MQTTSLQFFVEYPDGVSYGISACTNNETIVTASVCYIESADEASDDGRWLPSMNRKTKTDAFAIGERVATFTFRLVGNGHESFSSAGGNAFGCPFCIPCSRKVKYHGTKVNKTIGKYVSVSFFNVLDMDEKTYVIFISILVS